MYTYVMHEFLIQVRDGKTNAAVATSPTSTRPILSSTFCEGALISIGVTKPSKV